MAKTKTKEAETGLFEAAKDLPDAGSSKGELVVADKSKLEKKSRAVDKAAAPPAPAATSDQVLAMIERLAANPDVDADKIGKLLDAQERILNRNARDAFDAAFVAMQPDLPIITRDGRIQVREKDGQGRRTGELTQDTPYAKWETIDALVKPIMHRHGFALSHRIGTVSDAGERRVRVTAILRGHGHTDDSCYFDLPADTTGSKNNAQGWASAVSYAKRHTAVAVLNVITRAEDDDGKASGRPVMVGTPMTEEQVQQIVDYAGAVECPSPKLIDHLNAKRPKGHPEIKSIDELPAERLDEAIVALKNWETKRQEREAAAAGQRR